MKAFQQINGARRDIFHEVDLAPDLEGPYRENALKVLALDVDESVTFPSGVQWKRLPDDTPKTFVIVCHRGRAKACKYCGRESSVLCDYPVTRNGKPGTCDIPMCTKCRTSGGKEIDYCIPHAKIVNRETGS